MSNSTSDGDSAADLGAFMRLVWPGPVVVQAISTAARLKIADRLAEAPRTTESLAVAASVQPKPLERLLRALGSVGLFCQDGSGEWHNTPLSELLRKDHARSMRSWALTIGAPFFWRPIGELHRSIATGQEAFSQVFEKPFFDYLKADSEAGTLFNQAMAAQVAGVMDNITEVYDFSRFDTVADVGGGTGRILATILRACPNAKGVLLELPDVIEEVDQPIIDEFGDRLKLQSGDFFDSVPEGLDCYLAVRVIHDWPDEKAVEVLRNIRRAMKPDGTLLLVEGILDASAPPGFAMMDMLMLVLTGSMERTEEEFRTLLNDGGFALADIIRQGRITMLECAPL